MKQWFRQKTINILTRHLFNTITESEILRSTKDGLFLNGVIVGDSHARNLSAQSQMILETDAWNLLVKDMQFVAHKKIYLESTEIQQVIDAKLILWVLDVMSRKLYSISKLK